MNVSQTVTDAVADHDINIVHEPVSAVATDTHLIHTTHFTTVDSILSHGLEPGHKSTIERVFTYAQENSSGEIDQTPVEIVQKAEAYLERVRADLPGSGTGLYPARDDCVAVWTDPTHAELILTGHKTVPTRQYDTPVPYVALLLDQTALDPGRWLLGDYQHVADLIHLLHQRATTSEETDAPDATTAVEHAFAYWVNATVASHPDSLPTQYDQYALPELLLPTTIPVTAIDTIVNPPDNTGSTTGS